MHAANALIGVAVSNRLPNVTIGSTNAGTTATTLSSLFTGPTQFWALAGLITQPLFDGGNLLHHQRAAEANYQQTVALYQQTVINAFQNVADTLQAIKHDAIALKIASVAEHAARQSLNVARRQHALGDGSLQAVLLNEQNHLQTKMQLIEAQAQRLSNTVALFQALGGEWWHQPQLRHPETS